MTTRTQTARSASIISLFVMASRVLGLLREQIFAYFFGATAIASVFINAFRIPNLLRDLFAEGALSTAFVTTFSKKAHQESDAAAWRLANLVTNALLLVVGTITLLGIIFAPQIVHLVASRSDFSPEHLSLMVLLIRVMFPFLLLVSLASVSMGMLNSKNIFGIPASASSFFNMGSIIGGFGLAFILEPAYMLDVLQNYKPSATITTAGFRAILGVSIGVLVGGFLQWFIQSPALRRAGYRYKFIFDWKDPGLRQVILLMGPAVIASSATQVNVLVNTIFANDVSERAASFLYYAFRFLQLPIGLFGVAIGTAMLPSISRSASAGNLDEFRSTLNHSLQLVIFLCVPSTIGLLLLGDSIVGTIYQLSHKFTAADTLDTTRALQAYSLGLVAYSVIKIMVPAFYALGSSKAPTLVSVIAMGFNLFINYMMVKVWGYGHVGLAAGTSLVILSNALLLTLLMRDNLDGIWDMSPIRETFFKVLGASLLMGLSGGGVHWLWKQHIGSDMWILRAADLGICLTLSLLTFVFACKFLGVDELDEFTGILRRKRSTTLTRPGAQSDQQPPA